MKLAVIGGDGIGPEVVAEAVNVLDAVLPGVQRTEYDLGARRYHATGELLPDGQIIAPHRPLGGEHVVTAA